MVLVVVVVARDECDSPLHSGPLPLPLSPATVKYIGAASQAPFSKRPIATGFADQERSKIKLHRIVQQSLFIFEA